MAPLVLQMILCILRYALLELAKQAFAALLLYTAVFVLRRFTSPPPSKINVVEDVCLPVR